MLCPNKKTHVIGQIFSEMNGSRSLSETFPQNAFVKLHKHEASITGSNPIYTYYRTYTPLDYLRMKNKAFPSRIYWAYNILREAK